MSADSPRRGTNTRCGIAVPAIVPPQVVSDRSILDSAIGFINDVTLANQPHTDPKDTITWARFETVADISDPRFGEDWELEGNVAPPLLLILGYGLGIQVWAIPANGEAVEVLSWRHGTVSALRVLPTPAVTGESDRADEPFDAYAEKRPLMAMCDGASTSAGGGGAGASGGGGIQSQFCAVNFVSLKTGSQVKTIKFKNNVIDILANRSSIVITFNERIAVFDARTLEDRLSITTCYPSPGINPNPVALGPRWLAYSEQKLIHTKRSGGGCDGDGVASYTATVLNAAKSFGKGLRELGEQVAAGLTGTTGSGSNSKNNSFDSSGGSSDIKQPGIITILDIKHPVKDVSPTSGTPISINGSDPFVAHFIAHSEAVVALEFDNTGMILVTADKRGHDFHVFRIQPHPVGSSLAAIHHLYVLHRGDTSAKVQNITFSLDSRWIAVSTLRGTTHVFPITPYGGPMGVRTHTSLHVVNKLSRFHRSAGLSADGRSSSPISHSESTTFCQSFIPYHNPTLPPYPRPTVVLPLAQLRQPFVLGSPPGSAGPSKTSNSSGNSQRQRLSSLSDDNGKPLSVCAIFAKSRSWLLDPPMATREAPHRIQRKAVDSLFVMAGHGALIQYDLDTKLASNVAKEKICDETPIELEVEAKAQWNLGRKDGSQEIMPPLSSDNWLIKDRNSCMLTDSTRQFDDIDDRTDSWLSQVEIITHAGPHRRLWMGPQFVFKTYNTPSGSNLSHIEAEAVEIGVSATTAAAAARAERSSPLNMPPLSATSRTAVPVLIESGSYSSIEQSPKLMDRFRHDHLDSDFAVAHGDTRLKEDLADAMRESPSVSATLRDAGRLFSDATFDAPFYDALAEHVDDDSFDSISMQRTAASVAALANVLPNISSSYDTTLPSTAASCGLSYETPKASNSSTSNTSSSIEKVVNPLGTVTTITAGMSADVSTDMLDEVVSQLAAEDTVIHENCDESLFRPVVAIFCDEKSRQLGEEARRKQELCNKPPEVIGNKLVVPVIAKERDDELSKKEKQKLIGARQKKLMPKITEQLSKEEQNKFAELVQKSKKAKNPLEKVKTAGNDKVTDNDKTLELESKLAVTDKQSVEPKKEVSGKSIKLEENIKSDSDKGALASKSKTEKVKSIDKTQQTADLEKESAKKTTTAYVENANPQVKTKTTPKPMVPKNEESKMKTGDYGKQETKVKTVSLNVAHLTDSLIELTEKDDKSKKRTSDSKPTYSGATKLEIDPQIKLSEPIEIYAQSKTSKKKLKKQNKSSSSSETEEIVEMATGAATGKKKLTQLQKESSTSSEESYADLTVNLLKNKQRLEETMYISFSEVMETESRNSSEFLRVAEVTPSSLSSNESSTTSDSNSTEPSIKSTKVSIDKSNEEHKEKIMAKLSKDETDKACKTVEDKGKAANIIQTEQIIEPEDDDDHLAEDSKNKNKSHGKVKKTIEILDFEAPSLGVVKKQIIKPEDIEKKRDLSNKVEKVKEKKEEDKIKDVSKAGVEPTREILKKTKDDTVKMPPPPSSPLAEIKKMKKSKIDVAVSETKRNVTITEQPKLAKKELKEDKVGPQSTKDGTQNDKKLTGACEIAGAKQQDHKADTLLFIDKFSPEPKDQLTEKTSKETITKSTQITATQPSAWKILSGAEMISKNLESKTAYGKSNSSVVESPSKISINKNTEKTALTDSLLSAATAINVLPGNSNKSSKKSKKSPPTSFDDFPMLKPLDALPPMPVLEPLEVLSPAARSKELHDVKGLLDTAEQESLINFESPLLENPALERKITPPLRGFTEQNLIFALCGSLHYENESSNNNKIELSPTTTLSLTRSSSALGGGETTTTDYKSLTENDEQFLSLEQSSQDTTKSSSSSSQTSSASEEIIIAVKDNKKLNKKQGRKKQQQLEFQKQEPQKQQQHHKGKHLAIAAADDDDDDDMRPLISMSESQLENYVDSMMFSSSSGFTAASAIKMVGIAANTPNTTTTTNTTSDSEGPMPHTTTSDDNNYCVATPSMATNSTMATTLQHKLKTKKLEHKINLIAAIEAATSSSTSSAEESGVEGGGGSGGVGIGGAPDTAVVTMTTSTSAICGVGVGASSNANVPSNSSIQQSMATQQSGSKKKTKRRKR